MTAKFIFYLSFGIKEVSKLAIVRIDSLMLQTAQGIALQIVVKMKTGTNIEFIRLLYTHYPNRRFF